MYYFLTLSYKGSHNLVLPTATLTFNLLYQRVGSHPCQLLEVWESKLLEVVFYCLWKC